ncbi:hypothetical protein Tco_0831252 [Tanacetum coccineum]
MFQGIVDIVVIDDLLMKKDIDEIGHEVGQLKQMQVDHCTILVARTSASYRFFFRAHEILIVRSPFWSKRTTLPQGVDSECTLVVPSLEMVLDQSTKEFAIHFPFLYNTIGFVVTMIRNQFLSSKGLACTELTLAAEYPLEIIGR